MQCRSIILSIALVTTPAISQTVYKCPQADGTLKFQQSECTGTAGQEVKVDTRDTGNGGLRKGEVRMMLDTGGKKLIQRSLEKSITEFELQRTSPPTARPSGKPSPERF
ncbi:MAG: hypothetical protein U1F42_08810 [Candidatus Competibacteraceae bacterium]